MVRAFLDRAFEAVGAVPKHIILDRGRQFDCEAFRTWCRGHGIKWRYGAAGKKGSIAVIERLIRAIKTECTRVVCVPFHVEAMRAELEAYVRWHNEHRPHTHLRGRTPDEVYFGQKPVNEQPRMEPRLKYPRDAWCASPQTSVRGRRGVRLALEVSHFEGRRHLPVIAIKPAA
jgi:hypothetical protein